MKSAVTISLVPEARGGPFVFWDNLAASCQLAKGFGFDAVEIFAPSADAARELNISKVLSDNGLSLAAMGTGAGWVKNHLTLTSPDLSIRNQSLSFIRSMIDVAGPLGAPVIIGSMQGKWTDPPGRDKALEWLTDGLRQLCAHAGQYKTQLIYEPLNRNETNMCNTIAAGVELLQTIRTKNIVLLADLFHMHEEETSIPDALRAGGKYIGHVHFVDSNRRPPGCGDIDYAPIITALRDIDYQGYLSAECLPWPDPMTAAKQTIKMFDTLTAQ
jgi:sugar phosphate isomerase/epimerase